ncbi:WD40-repeat-containing domain protein [Ochromonadaceae sp. CCMP2298]|nr:WD40-repeat-containing domain protein [Ochromonadaceae sp. CCMP2298]
MDMGGGMNMGLGLGSMSTPPRRGKSHFSSPSSGGAGFVGGGAGISGGGSMGVGMGMGSMGSAGREEYSEYSDRFIPSRGSTNLEEAFDRMGQRESPVGLGGAGMAGMAGARDSTEGAQALSSLLKSELLGLPSRSSLDRMETPREGGPNLFKYKGVRTSGSLEGANTSGLSLSSSGEFLAGSFTSSPRRVSSPKKPTRKIPKTPYKVLDAPSLQDDYYLNLVDWSPGNVLSVALGSSVYLWSACTSKVTRLCDLGAEDSVTSIVWAPTGNQIAVGTNAGRILLWDSTTCQVVREMSGHESRVGTMAWSSSLLASGSRDRVIYLQDPRIRGGGGSSGQGGQRGAQRHSTGRMDTGLAEREGTGDGVGISGGGEDGGDGGVGRGIPPPQYSVPTYVPPGTANLVAGMGPRRSDSHLPSPMPGPLMPPPALIPGLDASFGPGSTGVGLGSTSSRTTQESGGLSGNSVSGNSTDPCVVRELVAHKQEVCGLKWSFDEKMLASGGNDNKLFVWESGGGEPLCRLEEHTAAVKAVAWSPHQHGLLASGGGTACRHIRFWNALTSTPLHKIDTGSQVCNLMWSRNVNELVSTHGYSLNQVIVWKYPGMQKVATLTGHSLRVLYLAMSPDGQNIVTGAGDETLRFWNVFPGPRGKAGYRLGPSALLPNGNDIR